MNNMTDDQKRAAVHRSWEWYTGPLKIAEPCDRCGRPLRTDPSIVQRAGRRYHVACFLDYVCAEVDAARELLRGRSPSADAGDPYVTF